MILTVCVNPSVDSFWSTEALNRGTTNRSEGETFYPGGKGIHTAFALRELGEKVTTLGIWGGQTGSWLRQECNQKGINVTGPTVEEWNRLCITIKSVSPWNETELLGNGPEVDHQTIENFQSAYIQCLDRKNIESVIISGSTPRGFQDNFYRWLVNETQNYDIPAFVDASGPLLMETLSNRPFGIHLNQKEGQELSNKNNPIEIVQWLSEYCELTAVTAGSDGLYIAFKNKLLHVSHKINESAIFSTIGSGDCLLAGLCLAYLKNESLEDWAQFAVACGSANCIYPELGMLQAKDVRSILPDVKVEKC